MTPPEEWRSAGRSTASSEDETLELFYEGTETNGIESPDNIIVAPWGDLSLSKMKQ